MNAISQAIDRFQQGDEEAFNTLLTLLGDDIEYKVSLEEYWVPGYDADDIRQEMLLVLYQTAKSFKYTGRANYRTYFWKAVRFRFKALRRDAYNVKRRANVDAIRIGGVRATEEGDEGTTFDIPFYDEYDKVETLLDINRGVTKQEWFILKMRAAGYVNREINRILGLREYKRPNGKYSRSDVDTIVYRLKKRFQAELAS